MKPAINNSIGRIVVEFIKKYPGRPIRAHTLVIFENILNELNSFLDFTRRGVVGDRDIGFAPNKMPPVNVFNS
jgi:hypothetical protein